MASAKISVPKLVFTGVYLMLWPALMMWLSGDLHWLAGWVFSVWFVGVCAGCVLWLYVRDPELLAERYRRPGTGGQQRWDAYVVYGLGALFTAFIAAMPLDAVRFHLTPRFPEVVELAGALLLGASAFLLFRSFKDNTFLSPLVRHQGERAQRVVSTGVYRFVRHPMYLGACLMFIGAPLLVSSSIALAIGLGASGLLAGRIVGEERMLLNQLSGYAEYREQVRYRLIPFVW